MSGPEDMSAGEVRERLDRATLCDVCGLIPGLHRVRGRYAVCPLTRRTLHGQRGYARLLPEPEPEPAYTWAERMRGIR